MPRNKPVARRQQESVDSSDEEVYWYFHLQLDFHIVTKILVKLQVVFDRESYKQKLKAYKNKARKDMRKMCHLEFKKNSDDLLSTAHELMQEYIDFEDVSSSLFIPLVFPKCKLYLAIFWQVLSSTFEQLFLRDRDDKNGDGDNDDEENVGLQDVVESLHSKFQANFVKLMEPLGAIKKMERNIKPCLQPVLTK